MHILLLEDNPDHLELFEEMLRESYGASAQIFSYSLLNDALAHLKTHVVDVFLCDLQLPDSPITQTVTRLKELDDAPPIIVLTSLNDEQLAQQLLQEGIQDYLPKNEVSPTQLLRACNYAIERKKLNRSLLDKNEDYRAFCYSLTHDFKSSLWQIARFSEIFKAEARKHYPHDQSLPWSYLDKIFHRVENIQKLVDDLQCYLSLDASPTHFSAIDLTAAVRNAIDMLTEHIAHKNALVDVQTLPEINGSIPQMQLLFTNLISNGIKYNKQTVPTVNIFSTEESDHEYNITIRDNGIGIPAKMLANIFTPFQRLHSKDDYPGSGLGLSIVKRIVQYHGGRISVHSEEGVGTEFRLRLPKLRT